MSWELIFKHYYLECSIEWEIDESRVRSLYHKNRVYIDFHIVKLLGDVCPTYRPRKTGCITKFVFSPVKNLSTHEDGNRYQSLRN